ncbi:hypothetical protein GCM10020219_055150 [Nonomuraea dietziae]
MKSSYASGTRLTVIYPFATDIATKWILGLQTCGDWTHNLNNGAGRSIVDQAWREVIDDTLRTSASSGSSRRDCRRGDQLRRPQARMWPRVNDACPSHVR